METDIDDDEASIGIADVGRDQGTESLLSGCIPELESEGLSFDLHGFCDEIYADGGLFLGDGYVGGELEGVVDEPGDNRSFTDILVTHEHHFEFA